MVQMSPKSNIRPAIVATTTALFGCCTAACFDLIADVGMCVVCMMVVGGTDLRCY